MLVDPVDTAHHDFRVLPLTLREGFPAAERHYDVCVVGAGPLGIAAARQCADLGLDVLLLEGGGAAPDGGTAEEPIGTVADEARHAPLDIALCRALGGSSWWWGGRCLPMDAVDFMPRSFVPESGWPLTPADITPFNAAAAQMLDCGSDTFEELHPAWQGLGHGVSLSSLERWSRLRELARHHEEFLRASPRVTVSLRTRATGLESDGRSLTAITAEHGGATRAVRAAHYVLACGGLATTHLLKRHQDRNPRAFGGPDGALGRYYMGHLFGKIADIVLADPEDASAFDFFLDPTGTWVRRRLAIDAETQIAHGVLNTAFWLDNAAFHEHRHGTGILSAVYLALSFPPLGRRLTAEGIRRMHVAEGGHYLQHAANVAAHPLATALSGWRIVRQRYLRRPRQPGFLVRNRTGRYALAYHSEQLPKRESAALPGPDGRLHIDLRFAEEDAVSVVNAHAIIDRALRAAGKGYLDYHLPEAERAASVMAQATDGYHQEGLLRMGTDPARSIVDRDCRVHDFTNLHLATTGVFPTSGQANPTFTACALAIRLAHHLAAEKVTRAAA